MQSVWHLIIPDMCELTSRSTLSCVGKVISWEFSRISINDLCNPCNHKGRRLTRKVRIFSQGNKLKCYTNVYVPGIPSKEGFRYIRRMIKDSRPRCQIRKASKVCCEPYVSDKIPTPECSNPTFVLYGKSMPPALRQNQHYPDSCTEACSQCCRKYLTSCMQIGQTASIFCRWRTLHVLASTSCTQAFSVQSESKSSAIDVCSGRDSRVLRTPFMFATAASSSHPP